MIALDPTAVRCTLVSMSCTTSWIDWVHGELWLCPDGLLRKSRGWAATVAGSIGMQTAIDRKNRPTRLIGDDERHRLVAMDKRNLWITWDEIASAKLQSGPLSHALHLQLTDGREVSLRWLRRDGPTDFLEVALSATLSDRMLLRG
jgi:hypothetical protein